jgi:hypothetical protein
MSRFADDDYYDEQFPNQAELWWANLERSLAGKNGQQALRALLEALESLPEPKLVSGRLATEDGMVCTVGALALHRRVAAGERREHVLRDLAAKITEEGDLYDGEGADITASVGTKVGLSYSIAWRLAMLNDDDFSDASPERRYDLVVAWVRRALGLPEAVAA